jgi:hypothetical protein
MSREGAELVPSNAFLSPWNISGMAERKAFLLRVDPEVLAALQRWASDELRSLNGQIEYLLRQALLKSGRLKTKEQDVTNPPPDPE